MWNELTHVVSKRIEMTMFQYFHPILFAHTPSRTPTNSATYLTFTYHLHTFVCVYPFEMGPFKDGSQGVRVS